MSDLFNTVNKYINENKGVLHYLLDYFLESYTYNDDLYDFTIVSEEKDYLIFKCKFKESENYTVFSMHLRPNNTVNYTLESIVTPKETLNINNYSEYLDVLFKQAVLLNKAEMDGNLISENLKNQELKERKQIITCKSRLEEFFKYFGEELPVIYYLNYSTNKITFNLNGIELNVQVTDSDLILYFSELYSSFTDFNVPLRYLLNDTYFENLLRNIELLTNKKTQIGGLTLEQIENINKEKKWIGCISTDLLLKHFNTGTSYIELIKNYTVHLPLGFSYKVDLNVCTDYNEWDFNIKVLNKVVEYQELDKDKVVEKWLSLPTESKYSL